MLPDSVPPKELEHSELQFLKTHGLVRLAGKF
jgi:hypothetical protein